MATADASSGPSSSGKGTGYLFHELYFWHNPGYIQGLSQYMEPFQHFENVDTKRRCVDGAPCSVLARSLLPPAASLAGF